MSFLLYDQLRASSTSPEVSKAGDFTGKLRADLGKIDSPLRGAGAALQSVWPESGESPRDVNLHPSGVKGAFKTHRSRPAPQKAAHSPSASRGWRRRPPSGTGPAGTAPRRYSSTGPAPPPGRSPTIRSTSLSGRASPRAREPNRATRATPRAWSTHAARSAIQASGHWLAESSRSTAATSLEAHHRRSSKRTPGPRCRTRGDRCCRPTSSGARAGADDGCGVRGRRGERPPK